MKTEILSPAGRYDSLIAAVRCGADAVYFGLGEFNARRNADNFSDEEALKAISLCHALGVKSYITMNTLVSDDEIIKAVEMLKCICSYNTDALILQDLGLISLVRKFAPDILMHASTQMSVQTAYGINMLKEMGFCRAVLPRETSLEEIKNIRSKTDIELEHFVHGAQCMSVSGQCYLSAMLGSRSGNRGLCAQPCRLPFGAENGTGHDLSLKDLSLIDEISSLSDAGISSFKIEGRMKRPEYVAAAVTACKNTRENISDEKITSSLRAVFSRSGFTKGYFDGKLGRDMFGTRQKEDVLAANDVFKYLQRLYDRETPLIPVDFCLTVKENKNISLSASSGGKSVYVEKDTVPEKALNKPLTKESLSQRLSKCGGTYFYADKIEIKLDDGLITPASVINELRREALEKLFSKLSEREEKRFQPENISICKHSANKAKLYARFLRAEQIPDDISGIDTVYLPLDADISVYGRLSEKVRVGAEIPRGIFGSAEKILARLRELRNAGIKLAYCGNLDGVALAKEAGMNIHTGFALNIFNTLSLCEIEKLGAEEATVSCELTLSRIKNLGGKIKRGIIAYGNIPLMLTRNCPIRNGKTCGECRSSSLLTDRMGIKFPVVCTNGCSEILNSRPIYLSDRLDEIKNVDFLTLYFTTENKDEVSRVIKNYADGKKPDIEFTRGLYYRGVE